jgi:CHASE3 domain sensor protein
MVIALVVVLVVVCVAAGLFAYTRSDKSTRDETHTQYMTRREGDALEQRYQEEQKRKEDLPPTHET